MSRTVALAGVLLLLTAACEVPGSRAVAQGYRCGTPQARRAPAPLDTVFEPAWRTYRDGADRLSISLPDSWGGVFTGTDHTQQDLAAVAARLPEVMNALQRHVADYGTTQLFIAVGGPAAVYLSKAVPMSASQFCVSELSGGSGLTIHPYRVRLAGAAATELIESKPPANSSDYGELHLVFHVAPPGTPSAAYRLEISSIPSLMTLVEPLAWRVAASLAAATGTGTSVCMYPDPSQPGVDQPAGRTCPIALGDQVARLDCPPPDTPPFLVHSYETKTGQDISEESIEPTGPGGDSCAVSVDPGQGVSLRSPNAAGGEAAIVADFWAPDDRVDSVVGLALRLQQQSSVFADVFGLSRLDVLEQAGGTTQHVLDTYLPGALGDGRHRFVLSASGTRLQAWLDGSGPDPVATTVPVQQGSVELFFTNTAAPRALGFKFQGVVAYTLAPGTG